jgi:hypothetical protein
MPIPSSYTENQLRDFMLASLQELGAVLGLTAESFAEAVNDTLLAYGVAEIANATNVAKLRALARVEAWRAAVAAASARIDWSEAGASFKQSQYRAAASDGLARAQMAAAEYGEALPGYVVSVGTLAISDPYAWTEDEDEEAGA